MFADKEQLAQVRLTDHAAYPVQIKWINEKLIYIRAWWGRLIGTDLIFDVESDKILTKKMVKEWLLKV